MIVQGYKYQFLSSAALEEAAKTLLLAALAAEGLHGESRVRMDAAFVVDVMTNTIVVDASTAVGDDIASMFTAFISKELGRNKFFVRPLEQEGQA